MRLKTKNLQERPPLAPNNQVLHLTRADVRKALLKVNPWRAAGPDNVPDWILRECTDQVAGALIDIFNTFLSTAVGSY